MLYKINKADCVIKEINYRLLEFMQDMHQNMKKIIKL